MAKAAGTPRIIIPNLDSPGGSSFKAAAGGGENGNHKELSRTLAEALKLDRGDGSELTPRSRASWASQVEEEHEATGWTGLPRPAKESGIKGVVLPSPDQPDDAAAKKSKKKKKHKKKSKVPVSSTGEDIPSPASGNSQRQEEQQLGSQSAVSALDGSVEATGVHPELPINNSLKGDGSNASENVDRKGRSLEAQSSPAGRIKGGSAVWDLKRSDSGHHSCEHKAVGPLGRKLPSRSSWQVVESKDATFASPCNPSGESGWDVPASKSTGGSSGGVTSHVDNEDSGGKVSVPRVTRAEPTPIGAPDVSASRSPNGGWDEPPAMDVNSNWDSGWEVAGSRRGKKGDDRGLKSGGGPNAGRKAERGGQQFQPAQSEYSQRGAKQFSSEREKVIRGVRSPGSGVQEKVGQPSPRHSPGPSNFGGARQAPPTQSSRGKPLNKSPNSSSNRDTQPVRGSNSGTSVNSGSILGKLLPQVKAVPELHSGTKLVNDASISLDGWKGGFPPFSGNGSSVFDEYPPSLYSDSQCSEDDLDSDTNSLASFESEDSHKSHSTQKMNKWFRNFFQDLEVLTEEQIHEYDRQWHCPACQGGVGAIDWYRGLQPLLAHAKTVRSKRVKLHKAFAEVLEEEIRIRGTALGTHGSGKYGKWSGLGDENESRYIVWPPMVVVRNTQLEKDEDGKWIGMGNKELLDLFKMHNPVKARHAYGPQGHRGISILVFADSPDGYYSAQRLQAQFIAVRRGKDNWDDAGKVLFQPGGDRILYGYMACPEDLDFFNMHGKGKQNLKWERKSFKVMVVVPMRRQAEENSKVMILEDKIQRGEDFAKVLKKTVSHISKKLGFREDENKSMRSKFREEHERRLTELDDMETSYKEEIQKLKQQILEQEGALERVQEEAKLKHMQHYEKLDQQASKIPKDKNLSKEQQQLQASMEEEIARQSELLEISMDTQKEYEATYDELLKVHHQKWKDFLSHQHRNRMEFQRELQQEREGVIAKFYPTKMQMPAPGSNLNAWK